MNQTVHGDTVLSSKHKDSLFHMNLKASKQVAKSDTTLLWKIPEIFSSFGYQKP